MLGSGCVRAQRKARDGNKNSIFMQCVQWPCIDPVSQSNLFRCKSCLVWFARSSVILCTAFKLKIGIERKTMFFSFEPGQSSVATTRAVAVAVLSKAWKPMFSTTLCAPPPKTHGGRRCCNNVVFNRSRGKNHAKAVRKLRQIMR